MAATPDDNNINGFLSGWGLTLTPHPCDACHVAAALLYCKADSAFFCGPCDAKIHPPTRFPKHERVWVCEVCEQSPAMVDCKADSAALCSSCDHDIHSANPLSRRHERVPVTPFLDSPIDAASSRSTSGTAVTSAFLVPDPVPTLCPGLLNDTPGDEADAWLIPNPSSSFLYNESDILNFVYNNGTNIANYPAFKQIQEQDTKPAVAAVTKNLTYSTTTKVTDSVGPTQSQGNANNSNLAPIIGAETLFESCFNIDFTQPNKPPKKNDNNNNNACLSPSFNYSVSSSETGVVPDGNASSMSSEVSYSFATSTVSVEGGVPVTDREARVLRYREKRKNRKFQKTIRYASRKAYAETRPRVKGRFAKRTDSNETSGIDFAVDNR